MEQAPALLLINAGEDSEFFYATRFLTEDPALYIRFGEGDDVLVLNVMEIERGRQTSTASQVVDRAEHGWREDLDGYQAWAQLAAGLLRERGQARARVSGRLPAAYYEELRSADVDLELDKALFVAQRRRKSAEEADWIHAAQRAAEAACAEIVNQLAAAEVKDGDLWADGRPLTSERLLTAGQAALNQIGYSCDDMIVAGSPLSAMPHWRGEGPILANAPVIIDIFPRGRVSRYHGDLTRTVVVGETSADVQRMHLACLDALAAAIAAIRPGVNGRAIHEAACKVLVGHGFGTVTPGFEGSPEVALMTHSTGHGVGLDVHELPVLRPVDMLLEEGDVVTVEPGLYKEGLGGVRVEDTGIVTADGFRNFTSLTRSLDPKAYR